MNDNELRGIILKRFYDNRKYPFVMLHNLDLAAEVSSEAPRICRQLIEHGLIEWHPRNFSAAVTHGRGRITTKGVDVVEGVTASPVPVHIDQSRHYSFANSNQNIIGDQNTQIGNLTISEVLNRIDRACASEENRREAKNVIVQAFAHPAVRNTIGAAVDAEFELAVKERKK